MTKRETQYTHMNMGMIKEIVLDEMVYDDGTFGHFIRVEDAKGNVLSLTLNTDRPESAEIRFKTKRSPKEAE